MSTTTKKVSNHQYLIVGGTTKAATTSLFTYLADHPAVCGATYKETRFFLHTDYPLPSKYRFSGDVKEYNLLFPQCNDDQIRLESTPDYLYCQYALESIVKYLPNAKLVFSLREPISRLISWYRFAKQDGKLPQDLSCDDYVKFLFDFADGKFETDIFGNEQEPINEQHWLTLKQGCYSVYLKEYYSQFEPSRLHILFFEDLARDPARVLKNLSRFAGIDASFYEDYAFKVTNRTETMKNTEIHKKYRDFRFQLRKWTHNKPMIHNSFRLLRQTIEPIYLRLNTRPTENVNMSETTRKQLIDYYRDDVHNLAELIGKMPPWQPFTSVL